LPFLHARKHRASAQNLNSCVRVGMDFVTAMLADEARLAFAASFVYAATGRTGLRRIGGIDLDQPSSAFFELVGKNGFEDSPSLIENGSVETGFLTHHLARLFNRSFGARSHVLDVQIFQDHDTEALDDAQGGAVMKVATDACAARGQPRTASERLGAALRASLLSGKRSLRRSVAPVDCRQRRRDGKHFARAQRQRVSDAAIYPNRRARIGWRFVLNGACEADVPTEHVMRNSYAIDLTDYGARVAESHPADAWKPNRRPFGIEVFNLHALSLEPESVIDALLTVSRICGPTRKEVRERLIKIMQRLFDATSVYGGDPIELGSEICYLQGLRCPSNRTTCVSPELAPPCLALLKSQVINEAANTSELKEQNFLLVGWRKLETKSAMDDHELGRASGELWGRSRDRAARPTPTVPNFISRNQRHGKKALWIA